MSQEKTIMKSALLFVGLLATSAFAGGNALTGVSVVPSRGGVEVTVKCEQAPVFNVFRLKDPDRLVVDVSSANVDAIKGHHEGAGPVTGVVASQFSDAKAEVGRLLLGLANARRYDVKAVENSLIITIEGEPLREGDARRPADLKRWRCKLVGGGDALNHHQVLRRAGDRH